MCLPFLGGSGGRGCRGEFSLRDRTIRLLASDRASVCNFSLAEDFRGLKSAEEIVLIRHLGLGNASSEEYFPPTV